MFEKKLGAMKFRTLLVNYILSTLLTLLYCHKVISRGNFMKGELSPVILIPGDGGCQIEAKWNKTKTVGFFCQHVENDWTNLWLSLSELVPYAIYCFVDNTKLVYDGQTGTTSNSLGVSVRVPGFGNTSTVEYLDPFVHTEVTSYFYYVAESLIGLGYQRDVSVKGAPFDFRKAPNELQDYFQSLQSLIKEMYAVNSLKITLIAHSMGSPVLHAFLNQLTQSWKDKYIQSIISLSGAWGGSVKPIKVYAIGDNLGSYFISAINMRPLQISFPSLAFLLPSRELWGLDDPLILTPKKNYTIHDIEEYFEALNNSDGFEMYKNGKDILYKAPPPGVQIHCLHGVNVPTINQLYYKTQENFPWSPVLLTADGDGTVNLRSLEFCLNWQGKQKQKIYHQTFPKVDHMQILSDTNVLKYITDYLKSVAKTNAKRRTKRYLWAQKSRWEINSIQQFLERAEFVKEDEIKFSSHKRPIFDASAKNSLYSWERISDRLTISDMVT